MRPFENWSNLSLRAKGLIVSALPAAAMATIACAAYVTGTLAEKAESKVNLVFEAREEIQKAEISEIEASASARGYFLTRSEAYAAGVRKAAGAFDTAQQRLTDLVADQPVQRLRLAAIEALKRARFERIFTGIAGIRRGVLPAADLQVQLDAAERERQVMEALLAGMMDEENALLGKCSDYVQTLRRRIQVLIAVGVWSAILCGLIGWRLFSVGILSRIGSLKVNVAKLATGGELNPGPCGSDEIGLLSAGIARTAEILRQRTAALQNALHGIAQAHASGQFLSCNKACSEMLGLGEPGGPADIYSSVYGEDRGVVEQAVGRMRSEGRGEVEARIPRADGRMADVAMTFLPVTENRSNGFHIFLRDVSGEKEAQAALIRAKDAAVASNRARTDFLAKISHDIRTPLNAILGAADLLSQTPLNKDQNDYVSMFQRNCRRLVALINDFLDFSRIEAGAVRVERIAFRVRQIADDTVRTFATTAARKGVALNVEIAPEIPDWIMGDPLRIQQVLTNLLSNALKFIREGKVTVRLYVAGADLRFEVADTGPGIEAADRERIFAPFTQLLNQSTTSIPGSGLGLTICRELVQLMDGQIGVQSEDGGGSNFYFTVPLELAPPEPTNLAASKTPGAFTKLRQGHLLSILIAEDTEDNRVLLRHFLREQPVVLDFAQNGHEAVEAVRTKGDYDLILMDIDMPELDGCAATRQIVEWEASAGLPPTPIVALSAHAIHEQVRTCLEAGCIAHVAKPIDQATLIESIERYARVQRPKTPVIRLAVSDQIAALVPGYLASKRLQVEEALAHLTARRFEPVQRFGHNLKGTARAYGFPEMETLGSALQDSAKEADEGEVARQLLALHRMVREAEPSLEPTKPYTLAPAP